MTARRESEDADIARALVAGAPDAPRQLWRRFAPLVFRLLRRTLGPGNDVEDFVQEIFLCVLTKATALREPTALRKFIVSTTVLTARCEIRRRWVRRWVRLATKHDASEGALVHIDHESREALRRFYDVLDRLGPRDRTLFVLRFIEELNLTEVAATLGLSLATTKRRLVRTSARIRLLVERDPLLRDYLIADAPGTAAVDDIASWPGRVKGSPVSRPVAEDASGQPMRSPALIGLHFRL